MAKRIDMTEVSVAMAAMRTRTEGQREAPGTKGVVARLQYDVSPELTFWRVREINRGTSPAEMQEALLILFATTVMSEVHAITQDPEDQCALINEWLNGFAAELGNMLSNMERMLKNAVVSHLHEQH